MYMLAPQGYKELILLKNKAAAGTVSYSITAPGFDLRLEPTGEVSFLSQGVVVAVVPQPAVWDSSPSPVHTFGAYSVKPLGDGKFEVLVEVDPAYLEAATFPVTIDPGSQYVFGQGNDDTYVSSDAPDTDYRTSWLQVANGSVQKHAFVRFDTDSFQRDDRIVYGAELSLYVDSGPTGGPMVDARRVTQAWPTPLTWNTQPTVDSQVLDSANCSVCVGWMQFDLKEMYQHVLQTDISTPWSDHGIRASTDGSATYVFRSAESAAGPVLALVWNDLPSAPNLDKPATAYVSEDDTPTLKIEGGDQWPNDNNGDDVLVQFQISDDASDFSSSHIAWESPWIDTRSYVVPSGVLVDGQTYYWRARSWDICLENTYQMCSLTDGLGVDHERNASNVRSFTVVLKHFGDEERWAMWEHALGNAMTLEVNEANGNLFLDVPLDSLSTPVGDLQVGLTYNSQQDADYGLSRGWDVSIGAGGSMRDMPIELVKLSDYPHNGVKIRLHGGRLQYFPHRDHRVFATV
ncbi:MAG: DNRLRE domain-containing protein, partial [Acidimicrobiia bacterium]